MFGVKVTCYIDIGGMEEKIVYRNVTEIHYNYSRSALIGDSPKIAFESDIHGTGGTWMIDDILEFETIPEEEVAEEYTDNLP